MNSAVAPVRPAVSPRLLHAFGGVARLARARLLTPVHLGAFALLLALLALIAVAMADSAKGRATYVMWTVEFYYLLLVPIVAFLNAGGAARDDLRAATVDYVLTRPVPRMAYVAFRYVTHVVGAQLEFLVAALMLAGIGAWFDAPGQAAALPALLGAQGLLVLAFSALGWLAGTVTARYVVVGLVYGAVVEGGLGRIPTQLSRLSMTQQVRTFLAAVDPAPATPVSGSAAGLFILLVLTVLALAAAATLFRLRELAADQES